MKLKRGKINPKSFKYTVHVSTTITDRPRDHEMYAATILANKYFYNDITFKRPNRLKTPDLIVGKEHWEIKSPQGNSKNTIQNNMKLAGKQSKNIVIDLSRTKMPSSQAIARIQCYAKQYPRQFKRIVIILKNQKCIDIL